MSAKVLPTYTPGSDQWVQQRAGKLGGSEIAAVMGLSPFESRFSLWHRKAGLVGPTEDNPVMEWGRRLEPAILAKYKDTHSGAAFFKVYTGNTYTRDDRPYQIASPDGLHGDVIIEAKTARFDEQWGTPGTDEIPVYYRAQVLWYMDCLDIDRADVAVLIAGSDYREYTVRYDKAEAEMMRAAAMSFLFDVHQGNRPPIDSADATYQVIKELHPAISPESVELDPDIARAFCESKHAAKAASAEAQLWTSVVADSMGDAQYATFAGDRIARRQARKGGTPYVQSENNLPTFETRAAA